MSQWQPIETAPKDKSVLLLADDTVVEACWCASFGIWSWNYLPEFVDAVGAQTFEVYGATHWMPRPEPPEATE